jgi:hypothetical protein
VSKFVLPSRATVAIASELDYNSPDFQEKFPHNLGFIALSGVGFNPSRTQAAFTSTTFVDYAAGDATY